MSFSLGPSISSSFRWLFRFPFCRQSLFFSLLHVPPTQVPSPFRQFVAAISTSPLPIPPWRWLHKALYDFAVCLFSSSFFPYAPWFLHSYAPILSPHALHPRLLAVLYLLILSCLVDSNVFRRFVHVSCCQFRSCVSEPVLCDDFEPETMMKFEHVVAVVGGRGVETEGLLCSRFDGG